MTVQKIIGIGGLVAGLIYAVIILVLAIMDKNHIKDEPGKLWKFMITEFVVYMLCAMGFPDFVMNTIVLKKFNATEDKYLPDNLVGCCLVSSPLIAFFYLNADGNVEIVTLALFMLCLAIGSSMGSMLVSRLDGNTIKKCMVVLIVVSMIFIIIKMIVAEDAAGTVTGLRGWKLYVLLGSVVVLGGINMMGVPIKPTVAAILLLLGVAPMTVITMIIVLGCITPLSGGVRVVKDHKYNKKFVIAGMTTGSIGATVGASITINLSSFMLSMILLAMMTLACVTLLGKKR